MHAKVLGTVLLATIACAATPVATADNQSYLAAVSSITWKRVEDSGSVRDASLSKILASLGLPTATEILGDDNVESTSLGRGLSRLIPAAEATPHDDLFRRVEDQLRLARNAVRRQDYSVAVTGIEGVQTAAELLLDRLSSIQESVETQSSGVGEEPGPDPDVT